MPTETAVATALSAPAETAPAGRFSPLGAQLCLQAAHPRHAWVGRRLADVHETPA